MEEFVEKCSKCGKQFKISDGVVDCPIHLSDYYVHRDLIGAPISWNCCQREGMNAPPCGFGADTRIPPKMEHCRFCGKGWESRRGRPTTTCSYHPGKYTTVIWKGEERVVVNKWSCCQGEKDSIHCVNHPNCRAYEVDDI